MKSLAATVAALTFVTIIVVLLSSKTTGSMTTYLSKLSLTSPAFADKGALPAKYTCDSDNISPPLEIFNIPEGAKSLALIMDDPDAVGGTWDHWIVFNIEPQEKVIHIAEGREPKGTGGKNSWGKTGYGGPCPPSGAHRYVFSIYALNQTLPLAEGASKQMVEDAIKGRVIEKTALVGLYKRIR